MQDDLVLVYTTNNPMDAKAVAGNLESRGIQVFSRQEAVGNVLGITVGALGEVELFVRREDYDDAAAILGIAPADEGESGETDG